MKKIIAILLVLVLVVCFAACSAPEVAPAPAEVPEEPGTEVAGGWTINTENGLDSMPEKAATAWYGAMGELTGASYDPLALLGTQVVAGTNYMFLARETLVTKEPVTKLAVVVIYEDLQGNDELLNVYDFKLDKYLSAENSGSQAEQGLAGGFTVNEDIDKTADVSAEDKAAFEKAFDGLTGVGYTPVTVLASQVVAGQNLAFLAKGVTVPAEPVTKLYIVNVYKDLNDGASINNICELNLADLTAEE